MTADDFFLLSIAFGGFIVFALVTWGIARVADQRRDEKRGPDIRPDIDSPNASNGHSGNEAARSGRSRDVLRRLAGRTSIGSDMNAPA